MVHADDIEAAFRRVLYHPDLAVAFAYVFNDFVIVPVGQVFGSRSAPSYYCLLADIRQAIAAMSEFAVDPSEYVPLVKECTFSTSADPVVEVPSDSHHPSVTLAELATPLNTAFVDDTGVVAFLCEMARALNQSVKAAEATFGSFGTDRRGDCLQSGK